MTANEQLFELDFSKVLEIKINNKKPVILTDLTISLLAVSQQYQKFIETQTNETYKASTELYIKEVKSGSIIVELVTQTLPVVPLLWNGGSLVEWVSQLGQTFMWLLGELDSAPQNYSKQDLKQLHSIIEPVAKDFGSQLNITVNDQAQVNIYQYTLNSEQANAAQNRINKEMNLLETPDDNIHKKRVMYWKQAKFDESNAGDKAVIESITKTPVKVIFENNAVKKAMLAGDSRFNKPWQRLAYVVDVKVQTIQDMPKLYTIIDFHDTDTFDPET